MAPTSDWDEIKRLAADFQKAQLSSNIQRLSERNCIEIVSKLIELKLIDVIFTSDGKEYLTSQQLVREIKDELYIHGGRINVVDLAKELNVDLNQINACVPEIVRSKEVQLVSGYLIAHYYLEKLAREINEKLQLQGQISVGDLTLQYDLPAELLQHNIIERYFGKIIIGKQDTSDPRIFYTEEYIERTKAKIRGALMGLLKPTPIGVIINHCNLPERLFLSLFDPVKPPGVLTGRQAGALYVPACYSKSQNEWVTSFYKQNNYLEYDALTRLGISDPKSFIKRSMPNEEMIFLSSCVIGVQIKQQLETAIEECVMSKSYVDVQMLLPSVFTEADIEILLETVLKNSPKSTVVFDNIVFSGGCMDSLRESTRPLAERGAAAAVRSGAYQQSLAEHQQRPDPAAVDHKAERREERRKKAGSGKGGGGTQGRETKTKAVKKHVRSRPAADVDSDEGAPPRPRAPELVARGDLLAHVAGALEPEGLDESVVEAITDYLLSPLNKTAQSVAKELAAKLLQDASQSRKQTHSSAQDKINMLVNDVKLYEKGYRVFPFDQQPLFAKYLLKTLGSDILSEFCLYAASQCNLQVGDTLTVEQRNKVVKDLPEEFRRPFQALAAALAEPTLEAFYAAVDACLAACDMILKKADKKKDKQLIVNHREKLIAELESCAEPALVLHLAALAAFTARTHAPLHASGRLVPVVLAHLRTALKGDHYDVLQAYHELVTKYLTGSEEEKQEVESKLREAMPDVKNVVYDVKKNIGEK